MRRAPTFSVIVPAYNAEKYVEQAVLSVEEQDFGGSFEVIIVNDGSRDNTEGIAAGLAARYGNTTLVSTRNNGPLLARRLGAERATGDYLLFLDADDRLAPGALAAFDQAIKSSDADLVGGAFSRDEGRAPDPSALMMTEGRYAGDRYEVVRQWTCACRLNAVWGRAIRRSCFDGDGDYAAYRGMAYAEDLFQMLPIVDRAASYVQLADVVYLYRANSASSTSMFCADQVKDVARVSKRLRAYARRWGGDCVERASQGELLLYLNLLRVSELSSASLAEKRTAFNLIAAQMTADRLFGRLAHDNLRMDNRALAILLKGGRYAPAHALIQATQKIKALKGVA